jgi:uncharacterized delta-60 repeat protein
MTGRAHATGSSSIRNKWALRIALSAVLIAATLVKTDASSGAIDTTFGLDGTGTVLSTFMAEGTAVAIDHNRQIVVAGMRKVNGHSQIVVARYDPSGITLDLTFGNFGIAIGSIGDLDADNVSVAVAIDNANRVIVGGSTQHGDFGNNDFLIGRYTAQGVLDVNFNPGTPFGWRSYDMGGRDLARGMAVDSQGRIVLVGSRLGDQEQQIFCHILGLCVPGDDIVALRVTPLHGDPDGSFGDGGHVAIDLHDLDEATNVAIDEQDRVVIVGANQDVDNLNIAQVRVIRFNVDGSRDDSFGIRGTKSFTFNGRNFNTASAVAIDRFGRIVVAGLAADSSAHGTFEMLDRDYNGTADFALARLKNDGSLDNTFGDGGIAPFVDIGGFDDVSRAIAIDASDRILVGGSATSRITNLDFAIVRYNVDGSVDSHYGVNGIAQTDLLKDGVSGADQIRALAFDDKGRTIAGGVSFKALDQPFFALARYVAEHPDFSVSTAANVPLFVAGSASTTIAVNSIAGLNSPVTLRVTGAGGGPLPAGFRASFDGGGADITVTPPAFGTATTVLDVTASAGVTPGTYRFAVSAQPDSPDHPHSVLFTIAVDAPPDAVTDVISAFRAAGAIDSDTVANSLKSLLDAAQTAATAGDINTATTKLAGFLIQVELQRGKHIATNATIDGVPINPLAVLLADGRNAVGGVQIGSPQNPIVGYVTIPVGQAAANAMITLFDGSNQPVTSATTDVTGLYRIANTGALIRGTVYTLKVTTFPRVFTGTTPDAQAVTWQSAGVSLAPFVLQLPLPKP